jgi:hypothetical protein
MTGCVTSLEEFHADPMYAGDLHRADLAWAKHAASHGLTFEEITDKLLNGRDLSMVHPCTIVGLSKTETARF